MGEAGLGLSAVLLVGWMADGNGSRTTGPLMPRGLTDWKRTELSRKRMLPVSGCWCQLALRPVDSATSYQIASPRTSIREGAVMISFR